MATAFMIALVWFTTYLQTPPSKLAQQAKWLVWRKSKISAKPASICPRDVEAAGVVTATQPENFSTTKNKDLSRKSVSKADNLDPDHIEEPSVKEDDFKSSQFRLLHRSVWKKITSLIFVSVVFIVGSGFMQLLSIITTLQQDAGKGLGHKPPFWVINIVSDTFLSVFLCTMLLGLRNAVRCRGNQCNLDPLSKIFDNNESPWSISSKLHLFIHIHERYNITKYRA
ncbi:unnamed protein product [Clavelina lepadiformis]|uniref:Uncharacterized protein n=1 Tax=Clavelina lepadiformis TaxID=159417 RepID=A0ABP0GEE0_CLALP